MLPDASVLDSSASVLDSSVLLESRAGLQLTKPFAADTQEADGTVTVCWRQLDLSAPPPLRFEIQFGFRFRSSWTQLLLCPGSDECWAVEAPSLDDAMYWACRLDALRTKERYVVRVRAEGSEGWGEWSEKASIGS
jgi:hypothetical protein